MMKRRAFCALFAAPVLYPAAKSPMSQEMIDALRFRRGEQWPEEVKRKREAAGRPCMTINRVPGYLKYVTRGMRLSQSQENAITLDVVRKIRDKQVLYNLTYSNMVERFSWNGPRYIVTSSDTPLTKAEFDSEYERQKKVMYEMNHGMLHSLDVEMRRDLGIPEKTSPRQDQIALGPSPQFIKEFMTIMRLIQ